jgi:stress response protein SCP2
VFDFAGLLIDACFYNNLKACDDCIVHSGDELSGEGWVERRVAGAKRQPK